MILVNRRDFTSALKRANKLTPRNTPTHALRNLHLKIDDECITLRCTNLEQALVEVLPATNDGNTKPVNICVPTTSLLGIVNALPEHVHELPLDAKTDHIIVGTAKLPAGCPVDEFPHIPGVPKEVEAIVELPTDFMRHARYIRAAVSHDAIRYALTGMLFDFAHGNLVGCDGKRLHCTHLWEPNEIPSIILPPVAFDLDVPTTLLIPKPAKDDGIAQVFLYIENGYVATKTVDGTWPDYLAIVRKEHTITANVDRAELLSVVEQGLPMVNERSPACTVHLNGVFELQVNNVETGAEYLNQVSAELDGPEVCTTLDPLLLLSLLRTIPCDRLTLALRKPDEAIHIVSEDGQHWALLMPLNQPTSRPAAAESAPKTP